MTDFGESFRKARESLGVPLDKIAAETRISTRFLLAIENEEFHQLPGGIFNRGFIRAYAQRVGLDPERCVADYERISSTTLQPPETVRTGISARKPDNLLYFIAVGTLVALIAILYFANRNSSPGSAPVSPTPAKETQPATAPPPAPVSPPPTQSAAAAPADNAAPLEAPLVMELEAKSATWIRLTADGKVVDDVILQPGTTRRYTAKNGMDINIGNAGGITMKLNGRNVGVLGGEGKTLKLSITPENVGTIGG